jgi:hypothetical protein
MVATLRKRGLSGGRRQGSDSKANTGLVFDSRTDTRPDRRLDYGEDRYITVGHLAGRCVVLVWTQRGDSRRIISTAIARGIACFVQSWDTPEPAERMAAFLAAKRRG